MSGLRERVLLLLVCLGGCATPVVQERRAHAFAPRLEAGRIVAADGAILPLDIWRPQGDVRAVALALHGFNDYRQAFAEVGPRLAANGIATYAYDQRGFGATAQRGIWAGEAQLAEDAKIAAALLREAYPGRPLFRLGESMGGAVAMRVLGESPDVADGAALVAPAVWGRPVMNPLQRAALWLVAHTFPALRFTGRGLGIRASDNVAMLRALRKDPLVLKDARADALWGMTNLMDQALAASPALTKPVLVLYGMHDEIIPKRPTCEMLASLAPSARVAIYPNGYHMLTRDREAKVVLDDLAAWLVEPTAPLPSGFETSTVPTFCGRR